MKIVLNKCFGGFGVTKPVFDCLGLKWDDYGYLDNKMLRIESDDYLAYRCHPPLIAAIEKIGLKESSSSIAELSIVDVPDDVEWEIENYDGIESVHEKHRSW